MLMFIGCSFPPAIFFILYDVSRRAADSMKSLLIDTDPGVDDALALLLAWGCPQARVEAVTTVAGNVPLEAATRNLLRLLALRRPAPMPVLGRGADRPLGRPLVTATAYHGEDGL